MKKLLRNITACTLCHAHLPLGPRPVVTVSKNSRILIIGQAPGTKVHQSGIPWNDASGEELRRWLDVSKEQFYDTSLFGIMPMGFCYPGKGSSGDLPPRPECAPAWHQQLLAHMKNVKLTLLIGQYAQKYYLGPGFRGSLTETVQHYHDFLPQYFPLVHPSPRNRIWMKKNPWFETDVLPRLQSITRDLLTS